MSNIALYIYIYIYTRRFVLDEECLVICCISLLLQCRLSVRRVSNWHVQFNGIHGRPPGAVAGHHEDAAADVVVRFSAFRMIFQSSRISSSASMYTIYGPVTVTAFFLPGPRTLLVRVLFPQSAHEISTLCRSSSRRRIFSIRSS